MTAPALADVLAFAPRNETEETLIAFLGDPDFPVTDWNSGAVMRTLLELETQTIDDLITQTLPLILAEGFPDTSDGDWLAAVAYGLFGISKQLGTIATQTITIACDATNGPYVITAGARFFTATDGRRYVAATGGTVSTSGTLTLDVSGESPGAALGLVSAVAADSPMPGVSLVTAAIKIVSLIPQFGSNDETDNALIDRCLARWPSLTEAADLDRVEVWARAASTEVTRIRLDADPVNPGGVIATVAGVSGAISGGAVTAAQSYIDARSGITDYITAQNASNLTITATANVTVPVAQLAAIQAAADAAWNAYLASSQIGATVYRSQLLKAVMDAGAIDIQVLHLNGLGVDVTLSSSQVPVPDGAGLASLLTWVGV